MRVLRVIEIIRPLLDQYTYQAPESAGAVFAQYYAEEERRCLSMQAHPAITENEPFYYGTDEQARPDVVYAEIHGESVSSRVQGPPQETHAYEHQEEGKYEANAHETNCRDVGHAGVVQSVLQLPKNAGIVPDGYHVQP